jgi:hypothetical protein
MVSEQTRKEDERLREELRHVDLEKLKKVIKPLLRPDPEKQKRSISPKTDR